MQNEPKKAEARKAKNDTSKSSDKEVNIEEEVKASINTCTDKEGTIYSWNYKITENDNGEVCFNRYSKSEILNPRLKGLNLYARVNLPRFKLDNKEVQENGKGITKEAFEAFLELIKCPVWLEVMQDPMNVKTCLHKFWGDCIQKYIRVEKKECPTCRTPIGSRRLLRQDTKLKEIIERLIPNLEDYQVYEQEEVQRNIKAINKSDSHRKIMMEMQKIKERQFRAEIEEKKDQKSSRLARNPAPRRQEPRPRPPPRVREPLPDKKYRQTKRQKVTEEFHEINIKFKLKQLNYYSSLHNDPRPGKTILSSLVIQTNELLELKHLAKFIEAKVCGVNTDSRNLLFFVRGKNNKSEFDKIRSMDTSLQEVKQAYWAGPKVHSLYFMAPPSQ